MNARKIHSAWICALIAGFATSATVAKNADAEESAQRKEHITRQGVHREQRQANNPPRESAPRESAPRAVPPRHSPPASVPRPPTSPTFTGRNDGRGGGHAANQRDNNHAANNQGRYNNGGQNKGGNHSGGDHKGNDHKGNDHKGGGYYAGGRNPHFVPPPRYFNSRGNGNGYGHGYSHRHVRAPYYVNSLPNGYHRHYWNGNPYYYHGGHWYRPYGARYVVATAPYGLFVPYLPFYSSLWFGSTRYYYSEGNYYNYEPVRRGYVVARSPYVEDTEESEDLYFYPAQGQGEQQQTDDRYECHRWAVGETQYDPVDGSYDAQGRSEYDRALTACMTGRGYTVS